MSQMANGQMGSVLTFDTRSLLLLLQNLRAEFAVADAGANFRLGRTAAIVRMMCRARLS